MEVQRKLWRKRSTDLKATGIAQRIHRQTWAEKAEEAMSHNMEVHQHVDGIAKLIQRETWDDNDCKWVNMVLSEWKEKKKKRQHACRGIYNARSHEKQRRAAQMKAYKDRARKRFEANEDEQDELFKQSIIDIEFRRYVEMWQLAYEDVWGHSSWKFRVKQEIIKVESDDEVVVIEMAQPVLPVPLGTQGDYSNTDSETEIDEEDTESETAIGASDSCHGYLQDDCITRL